jgi:hypothetical protein
MLQPSHLWAKAKKGTMSQSKSKLSVRVKSTRDYEEDATALTFMIETTDDGHNWRRSTILISHDQAEKPEWKS